MDKFLCCVKKQTPRKRTDYRDLPGVSFEWQEIVDGTGNFHLSNHLGKGSFGHVYRCNLPGTSTGTNQVGAAKFQKTADYDEVHYEFEAEIRTLHAANHPNIIKLLGKSLESRRGVIVYEFMPKGSVDHYLYGKKLGPFPPQKFPPLDWETRMKIAVGVAEALVYLHEELKMIHRDVKDGNVLLDENFVPKLTDFGLATKIFESKDGTEMESMILNRTLGYAAPETEFGLRSSTKSDVYSYGVFLLTLFTGRKAYNRERSPEKKRLADWLEPVWSRPDYFPMMTDPALGNRFSVEGISGIFHTARSCVTRQKLDRPKMSDVEQMVREAAACEISYSTPVTSRRST